MADNSGLETLAKLLKMTQARRVAEQRPTMNFGALASPQMMGAPTPQAPPTPPVTVQASPAQAPIAPPITPPNPAPNLPPAADAQTSLPTMPAPTQIGPVAASTSIWDTLKKMLAGGQVPEGYRAAMGEMIKNQ